MRTTQSQQIYFDLEALCESLPAQLDRRSLTKIVIYQGSSTEYGIPTTDTTYWKQEFQLLSDCNINKSAFWGQYELIKTDTTEIYTALKPNFSTRRLAVFRTRSGQLRSVEVDFLQAASFFSLSRNIRLEFAEGSLVAYHTRVLKKVILSDSIRLETKGILGSVQAL